jgi:hypothetical protein
MQKSLNSPGKFNEMFYLSLLYLLLSHRDVNFVMQSTSFVAECLRDVPFVVEASCYEHGYCNEHRMQQAMI